MSIYLIDYENTGISGLTGIETLKKSDRVYLFYGVYTGSITFDTHIALNNTKAKIKYLKIDKSAKNYLDFQLATMSGYLIAKNKDTDFVIVSRDNGFNSVVDFWNQYDFGKKAITVRRQIAIAPTEEMLSQIEQQQLAAAAGSRPPRRGRSGFRPRRGESSRPVRETAPGETSPDSRSKDSVPKESAPAAQPEGRRENSRPANLRYDRAPKREEKRAPALPVKEETALPQNSSPAAGKAETEREPAAPTGAPVSRESLISKEISVSKEPTVSAGTTPSAETAVSAPKAPAIPAKELAPAAAPSTEEIPAAYTRIGPVPVSAPKMEPEKPGKPAEPKAHDSAFAYARLTPLAKTPASPSPAPEAAAPAVEKLEEPASAPVQTEASENGAPAKTAEEKLTTALEQDQPPVPAANTKEKLSPVTAETTANEKPESRTKPVSSRRPAKKPAPNTEKKAEPTPEPKPELKPEENAPKAEAAPSPAASEPAGNEKSENGTKPAPSRRPAKKPAPKAEKKAEPTPEQKPEESAPKAEAASSPAASEPAGNEKPENGTKSAPSRRRPAKKPAPKAEKKAVENAPKAEAALSTAMNEPAVNEKPENRTKPAPQKAPQKVPAARPEEKSAGKKELPKLTEHYKKQIRDQIRDQGLRSGAYNEIYRAILKSRDLPGVRGEMRRLFGEEKGETLYEKIENVCREYLTRDTETSAD